MISLAGLGQEGWAGLGKHKKALELFGNL